MYLITQEGLGQDQRGGNCSGWERDLQSFSKVIAEHYAATELGVTAKGNPYWCGSRWQKVRGLLSRGHYCHC